MKNIHRYIEHTNLRPILIDRDIDKLIEEAMEYQFLGVCVPPFWVKKASREIEKSDIKLITVIGFPFGYNMTETKLEEIKRAMQDGAHELDVVLNISAYKSKMPWAKIELAKCATIIHESSCIMKVILETAYMNERDIITSCKVSREAGADYVKTSTGFAPEGAKIEHVKLMRETLPSHVGIKASGGIDTFEKAKAFIEAGADRIGTSSGVEIVKGAI